MIESIFFKNSPLHDGALVIRGNRLVAASCTLPLSSKTELPSIYGMRHKAAIGMSEESDALVILVSEESGEIALSVDGQLSIFKDKLKFRERLQQLLTV